ncbi:hypothetical protein GX553_03580 [Candidatus Peribacteria bacterium]|nr:hypothetical protein [Candidatus Peribacteria bacterium]
MFRMISAVGITCLLLTGCNSTPPPPAQPEKETGALVPASQTSSAGASISSASSATEAAQLSTHFDPLHAAPPAAALPQQIRLAVPFTPQAPHANWEPPFDEACEEASLLMVDAALRGEATLSKQEASDRIRAMVEWQDTHSYVLDITAEQTARVAEEYLGRDAAVYMDADVTADSIRRLLAAGYPVIIPAAGQMLGNPYFSGEGPPYHMLVITGYEPGGFLRAPQFITNDPGTRRGQGYQYDEETIIFAIHDWTGSTETIREGRRAMLVLRARQN